MTVALDPIVLFQIGCGCGRPNSIRSAGHFELTGKTLDSDHFFAATASNPAVLSLSSELIAVAKSDNWSTSVFALRGESCDCERLGLGFQRDGSRFARFPTEDHQAKSVEVLQLGLYLQIVCLGHLLVFDEKHLDYLVRESVEHHDFASSCPTESPHAQRAAGNEQDKLQSTGLGHGRSGGSAAHGDVAKVLRPDVVVVGVDF